MGINTLRHVIFTFPISSKMCDRGSLRVSRTGTSQQNGGVFCMDSRRRNNLSPYAGIQRGDSERADVSIELRLHCDQGAVVHDRHYISDNTTPYA